jgi:hypothetical protein
MSVLVILRERAESIGAVFHFVVVVVLVVVVVVIARAALSARGNPGAKKSLLLSLLAKRSLAP